MYRIAVKTGKNQNRTKMCSLCGLKAKTIVTAVKLLISFVYENKPGNGEILVRK